MMTEKVAGIIEKGLSKEAYFHGSERARAAGEIALTFDDGPSFETARILDALNTRGIKATFFLFVAEIERLAQNQPELFKRIMAGIEKGEHEIGLHGDYRLEKKGVNAKFSGEIDLEKMREDKERLEDLVGKKINLFRPHNWVMGSVFIKTVGAAHQLEMSPVMLSLEVGVDAGATSVRQNVRIFRGINGGDIIDIHERRHPFYERKVTNPLEIVDALIDNVEMKGLKFATVSGILK